MTYPTAAQLRRAAAIRDRIEKLQRELAAILGDQSSTPAAKAAPGRKRRRLSPEGRARIAAAARARWARERARKKQG